MPAIRRYSCLHIDIYILAQLCSFVQHVTLSYHYSVFVSNVQISTVDAFQGGEKDLIILTCVRMDHIGLIDCDR